MKYVRKYSKKKRCTSSTSIPRNTRMLKPNYALLSLLMKKLSKKSTLKKKSEGPSKKLRSSASKKRMNSVDKLN